MAERTPKAPLPPMADYRPPAPTLLPCPTCGVVVLRVQGGEAQTALLGLKHVCNEKETVCP